MTDEPKRWRPVPAPAQPTPTAREGWVMINRDGVERKWSGGYYFDWFAGCAIEKFEPDDATQSVPRRAIPRHVLLAALTEEIEKGNSEAKLYGALLARALIGQNMMLMKQFGERIAGLTKDELKKRSNA